MTLAEMVDQMVAAGATSEVIAIAVKALTEGDATIRLEALRAHNRERQRRFKARQQAANVTETLAVTLNNVTKRRIKNARAAAEDNLLPLEPTVQDRGSEISKEISSPHTRPATTELIDWFEETWNGFALQCGLPVIRAMTKAREAKIRLRAKDLVDALGFSDPKAGFTELFNKIRGSPHLLGNNGSGWRCDADWVLTESKFLKTLESNPHAKIQRSNIHQFRR